MKPLKQCLKQVAIATTGSRLAQEALAKVAGYAEFLGGDGSGSEVESSGELAVFALLRSRVEGSCTIFDVGANLGQFLGATLGSFAEGACEVALLRAGSRHVSAAVGSSSYGGERAAQ